MNKTAILYCQKTFTKALSRHEEKTKLYAAFEDLGKKIAELDDIEALHWYSIATQWLEAAADNSSDSVNPLDVLVLRAESLLEGSHPRIKKAAYVMAVIAITLSVLVAGLAIGIGIGLLMGLWATPMGFVTALLAAEQGALIVTGVSSALGLGTGSLSAFLFFKDPSIKKSLDTCVDSIKGVPLIEEETVDLDYSSH
jgi:hypothetical protein